MVREEARADGFILPVRGLGKIALVCRAWYTLIAPALYSKLQVTDDIIASPLCQPVTHHARRITVSSAQPFMVSTWTAQLYPRPSPVVWLLWVGPDHKEARQDAAYHPSCAVIYSQLHRSYSNVIRLDLSRCAFLSSSDFLRLLVSFPALERVHLRCVSFAHVSESAIQSRPSVSLIRRINVDNNCTPRRHVCLLSRAAGHGPANRPTTKYSHSMDYYRRSNSLWPVSTGW